MSILSSILLSTLLLWSDRDNFSDPDKISTYTEAEGGRQIDYKQFEGGDVLLLIHGFNDTEDAAVKTYKKIYSYLSTVSQKKTYTHVIGYLWPGYDSALEYFEAKRNAEALASRLKVTLDRLSGSVKSLDVIAHSMGNRLFLESLKIPSERERKVVNNFFSMAPAVNVESIDYKGTYSHSTHKCHRMFVFHSDNDEVLKWAYFIVEEDGALGEDEAIDFKKIPNNIKFIDCSAFVDGHSGYFTPVALPIYEFISNEKSGKLHDLQSKSNRLVAGGDIQPIVVK